MPQSMLSILLFCTVLLEYRCDEDYGRSACSSIYNPLDPECGEDNLEASEDPQSLSSPQFQDVKEGFLRSCVWSITAKKGQSIFLNVLNVQYNQGFDCWPNSLKVYCGNDTKNPENEIMSLCSSQGRELFNTRWNELTIVFQVHESFQHSKFQLEYHASFHQQAPLPRLLLSFDKTPTCNRVIPSVENPLNNYQKNLRSKPVFVYNWQVNLHGEVLIYHCVNPKSPVTHQLLWSESPEMARRWRTECNVTLCRVHIDNLIPPLSGNYVFYARSGRASAGIAFQVKLQNPPEMHTHTYVALPYQKGHMYHFDCDFLGDPIPEAYWFFYPAKRIEDCIYDRVPDTSDWDRLRLETFNKENKLKASEGEQHFVCKNGDYRLSLTLTAADSGCLLCWSQNALGHNYAIEPMPVSGPSGDIAFEKAEDEPLVDEKFYLNCSANRFNFANLYWTFQKEAIGKAVQGTQLEKKDPLITSTRSSTASTLTLTVHFSRISEEHQGTYICVGEKTSVADGKLDQKTDKRFISLKVNSGPAFVGKSSKVREDIQSVEVVKGSRAVLNCSARGKRPLTYEWKRIEMNVYHVPFKPKPNESVSEKEFVEVDYSETEENRTVVCAVFNDGGMITRRFDIKFEHKKEGSSLTQEEAGPNKIIYWSSGGVIFLLTILGVAVLICWRRKKNKEKKPEFIFLKPKLSGPVEVNIPLDIAWEFPDQRLRLGEKIGHGAFGRVVKAEAFGICPNEDVTTVAIKMLKTNADASHKKALFDELKILTHLGRHLNVVNLLGAVTKYQTSGRLMIIVEYCEKGNLLHYLHKHRKNFVCQVHKTSGILDRSLRTLPFQNNQDVENETSGNNTTQSRTQSAGTSERSAASSSSKSCPGESTDPNSATDLTPEQPLTTYDLIQFSFQCSRGLEYIESRKLVHRDLSARNVLLTKDNIIKICDFGLTREQVYLYNNRNKGALPIRWMAPESLGQNQFTTKSDVWSFGILLWEMFTLGDTPYAGMPIDHEFYKKLFTGYRLDPPETTPRQLSTLMHRCWRADPDFRPCVNEIVEQISELLDEQIRNYYMILNAPYEAAQRSRREQDNMDTDDELQLDTMFETGDSNEASKTVSCLF